MNKDQQVILIHGNPMGGFTFFGPFASSGDAIKWSEENHLNESWWLGRIQKP